MQAINNRDCLLMDDLKEIGHPLMTRLINVFLAKIMH